MKTFCALAVICSIAMVQIASGKTYYYGKDIRSHLGQRYSEGAEVDDLVKVAKCVFEGLYNSEEIKDEDKTKLKEAYDWIEQSKERNELSNLQLREFDEAVNYNVTDSAYKNNVLNDCYDNSPIEHLTKLVYKPWSHLAEKHLAGADKEAIMAEANCIKENIGSFGTRKFYNAYDEVKRCYEEDDLDKIVLGFFDDVVNSGAKAALGPYEKNIQGYKIVSSKLEKNCHSFEP